MNIVNIDSGNANAAMFLDFKKAFDNVHHEILLDKLNAYGSKGTADKWFRYTRSYLNKKCIFNAHFSSSPLLQCEVPQGSISRGVK